MSAGDAGRDGLRRLHLRVGWWSLCLFIALGFVLEALHGFKVGWYLSVANQARRFMFTLAHAHGTLLGLVHLAFALTLGLTATGNDRYLRTISVCLVAATVLLPGGFFLGGFWIYDGDPGLGIFLVPPGGLLLLVALFLIAKRAQED